MAGVGGRLRRWGLFEGGFYVTQASPRVWTPGEIALIEEVAILSWDAVARADALASLRDLNRALAGAIEERNPERDRNWEVRQAIQGIAGAAGIWRQNGRASGRARGCPDVYISVVYGSYQTNTQKIH